MKPERPDPDPNLADLLLDHPFADDEPLLHGVDPPTVLTAGAARAAVCACAAELDEIGLRPGDAVAVRLPDTPATIVAMAGVWHAGCVLVAVNPRHPDAEVARVVDATRPAAILDDGGLKRLGGASARAYPAGSAFVLWTSGTTGPPKPILHSHRDYHELLDRVLASLRGPRTAGPQGSALRPASPPAPTPNLVPVGLSLNAGIYNVLFGLRAGAAVVVLGRFDTQRFAAAVREFAIRSTVLPPAAIAMLADDPSISDLSPLRYVRSITAPLAPGAARRFTGRFGAFVLNGYGQAEMGEVIGWTAADAKAHPDKIGAAGRPHLGVAVRLADVDGATGAGRLLVRPPAMAQRSAQLASDLAARTDAEGYVDTGDLARIDADGFVWIEGRAGDVINRGGNKVFPDEVEDVLRAVAGVHDAGVVGEPDERLGEVPVAVVVADGSLADADLEAACRASLAPYKVPVRFDRAASLPRNDAGKLLRRELLRHAGS